MPQRKVVAITGSHGLTRDDAPWTRKWIKVWVFNESGGADWPKRVDAVFQMHERGIWNNPLNRNDPNHPYWMRNESGQCNACKGEKVFEGKPCKGCNGTGTYTPPSNRKDIQVWMQEANEDVPNSCAYPLREIAEKFLPNVVKGKKPIEHFFSSSVSLAIALALYQGFEEIRLNGVEMASDTEYIYQREATFFWLGQAAARGVKVVINEKSNLFHTHLYGYEGGVVIGLQEFESARDHFSEEVEKARAEMQARAGRVKLVTELIAKAEDGDDKLLEKLTENYNKELKAYHQALIAFGTLNGALLENDRYIERTRALIKASGAEEDVPELAPVSLKMAQPLEVNDG